MTYKLNPIVGRFVSPIILRFCDGSEPDRYFENGSQLVEEAFGCRYLLESVCASGDRIVLTVTEGSTIPTITGNEDAESFF